jgi:hypothetical protein
MATPPAQVQLLPQDALLGLWIAISASESPDLGRLGLVETHFRLALAEIARSVLVSRGKLAYGGHLDPEGYTSFLIQELHRYSRRDKPLRVCLAWSEHRRLSLHDIEVQKKELGLFGDIVFLDQNGDVIDPSIGRDADPKPVMDDDERKRSLTGLREYMTEQTSGRVLIGGKRAGIHGSMPGVLEEAVIGLNHGQPLYLAGGFGGVTSDIIKALGVDDGTWLPELPNAPPPDERLTKGIGLLKDIGGRKDWAGLNNGLTPDENRKLAATHRPSEIAALISLGLGRRFST